MKLFYEKKEKKIKNNFNSKIYKNLIKSKNHLGCSITQTKPNNYKFLYGIKKNQTFINIEFLVEMFNKSFCFINNIFKKIKNKKPKILIVCDNIHYTIMEKTFNKDTFINDTLIYKKEWNRGFLTKNNKITKPIYQDISLVILLPIKNQKEILQEIFKTKIPTISFINTSVDVKNITYPLFINTKNIEPVFFVIYLLKTFFKKLKI